MKLILKLTIIITLVLLVSACGKTDKKEAVIKTKEKVEAKDHNINNDWIHDIQLDNGLKWLANIETTQGVDKMLNILKEDQSKTVVDYHNLADKLNVVKNKLVKECTMTGPPHDNLHIFLHPLIDKISHLQKVSTIQDGLEATQNIKENLDAYTKYFK